MGKDAKRKAQKAAKAEHHATKAVAAAAKDRAPVRWIGALSEAGDQPPLLALGALTLGAGALLRRPALARAGTRMLASHLIATAAKTLIKRNVDRTRPARALADGRHHAGKGTGSDSGDLNSFPSGHTAGAVAVAEAAANTLPATAVPARLAAGAIGAVQVPRAKHYLTDVVTGAAIGWLADRVAGAAIGAAERALRRRRREQAARHALDESEAHPS